jgi:hypothetical protein
MMAATDAGGASLTPYRMKPPRVRVPLDRAAGIGTGVFERRHQPGGAVVDLLLHLGRVVRTNQTLLPHRPSMACGTNVRIRHGQRARTSLTSPGLSVTPPRVPQVRRGRHPPPPVALDGETQTPRVATRRYRCGESVPRARPRPRPSARVSPLPTYPLVRTPPQPHGSGDANATCSTATPVPTPVLASVAPRTHARPTADRGAAGGGS